MQSYLFNICCSIATSFSFYAGVRSWQDYKKAKLPQFRNLSLAFFSISFAFLMLSLPKLFLFNPSWVQVDFILTDLSFLLTGLFSIPVILSFSENFFQLQKNIFRFLLFIFLVYVILNILFFTPAIPLFSDGVLTYFKNGISWLHSVLWIPLASLAGIFGGQFLAAAKRAQEKSLFWKGLLIGGGCILVFLAGILFWYFKFLNPLPQILNASGIIGIFGFTLGVIGVALFPPPREIFVKKIT